MHTQPTTSVSAKNKQVHSNAVQKYLANYAEIEIQYLTDFPCQLIFRHVLVIPCYRESHELIARLQRSFNHIQGLLIVLVVNQPQSDSDTTSSNELWEAIMTSGRTQWCNNNVYLIQNSNREPSLLAVQRFHEPLKIPVKQGVGLARKIGCDIAAELMWRQQIQDRWIYSSDADAHWPSDYFDRLRALHNDVTIAHSAAVYPFSHRHTGDKLGQATKLYEQSLHYYVDGLRWAGSSYAFHTIGSCLALNFESYCQVRGFPKRSGGEDFYILNKLAKLGHVATLAGEAITLEARESDRVPFGTGPAVKKIMAMAHPESELQSYNPLVFLRLKQLLSVFPSFWTMMSQNNINSIRELNFLPADTIAALEFLGFNKCIDHQGQQMKDAEQSIKHLHYWFDGFRTLKFIHYLQQNSLPAVPLLQALKEFEPLKNS